MSEPDHCLEELYAHIQNTANIPAATQIRNYVRNASLNTREDGMPLKVGRDEAAAFIGQEVGITNWLQITQERVNRFADATGDYQFLHIDQERALHESCYGGTIAHGLLTLSLLPMFSAQGSLKIRGTEASIIYGMDRLRFTNPVRIGKRIRGRFVLLSVEDRNPEEVLLRHRVTIEVENEEKPALLADWSVMAVLANKTV